MIPLPDLILKSNQPLCSETSQVKQEFTPFDESCYKSTEQITFPQISELQTDLTFSMGSQDLLTRIDEPNFGDVFGTLDSSEFGLGLQYPIGFPFFDPSGSCRIGTTRDTIDHNSKNSGSFFDDFPEDMFDHMEAPASP